MILRYVLGIAVLVAFTFGKHPHYEEPAVYLPKNFCVRLISNVSAVIQWVEPLPLRIQITGYNIYYTRNTNLPLEDWTCLSIGNYPLATIRNIELGEIYTFRVQANPLGFEGDAPISDMYQVKMLNRSRSCFDQFTYPGTIQSLNVLRAAATSLTSAEVWWNLRYDSQVFGFQVFYGLLGDMNELKNKSVGLVHCTELTDLKDSATYRIAIAAIVQDGLEYFPQETIFKVVPQEVPLNVLVDEIFQDKLILKWSPPTRFKPLKYKITYDAFKNFLDSAGIRQQFHYETVEKYAFGDEQSYTLDHLVPYTLYNINISAVPVDYSYRPSIKIKAQTEIAAPETLSKPEIYGIIHHQKSVHVRLPKASEEYGPVDSYYIIVVPSTQDHLDDTPTYMYTIDDLDGSQNQLEEESKEEMSTLEPYIAAKFVSRIPAAFILGNGASNGYVNRKLEEGKVYRVFVRAVAVSPRGILSTDSPYSDYIYFNNANIYKSVN